MNRTRLILGAVLCIFVAVIAVAFLFFGGKSKPADPVVTTAQETTTEQKEDYSVVIPDILPTGVEDDTTRQEETVTTQAQTTTANAAETTTAGKTEATTDAKTTAANHPSTTKKPATTAAKKSEYEYAYAGFNPSVATVSEANWNLLLVNQDYILPDDYTVKLAKISDGTQSLDYRVVPYYNKMVAAAKADGISLLAVSGYRSLDRQRANFTRKINYYQDLGYSKAEATRLASKIVLMPGTSEHNAGLAMDFGTNGNYTLDENFGKTEAYKWLSQHAADYGFIMRYPADKTSITKVTYEPWHWRYVGEKAAKEIKARGVTLEEYLGY